MFDAFTQNDLALSMMDAVAGEKANLDAAERAFTTTKGNFRAKFTAAVQARIALMAVPKCSSNYRKTTHNCASPILSS